MKHAGNRVIFHTKHLNRYRQIAAVFIRYGFEDIVSTRGWKGEYKTHLNEWKILKKRGLSTAERIRLALEELGPTFIKFGQIMSNRPDILSQDILIELQKLQQNVAPFPGEAAQQIIEEELQQSTDDIFESFSVEPLASASIAQVHMATLKSGEKVVVKVRRPGICKTIKVDTEIMFEIASFVESVYPPAENLSPSLIVREFEKAISRETDFVNEANNINRFANDFKGVKNISVPKVYLDLSTDKILCMEFVDGLNPMDTESLKKQNIDTHKVAENVADLVLKQIFEHGFFHADPHPGNIRVLENGDIAFLDYGMMGYMMPKWQMMLADMMIAFTRRDVAKLTDQILMMTSSPRHFESRNELEAEIDQLIQRYSYLPLKSLNMGVLIQEIFKVIFQFKLKIPPTVYLLSKAIITIEGVARRLDPEFNLIEYIKPYAKKRIREKMSLKSITKDSYAASIETAAFLKELPSELRDIVGQIKSGDLQMNFQHKGLESATSQFEKASNRIAFAMVLAALIIGSSIVTVSNIPPYWHEVPIIGALGFIASIFLGFTLLFHIFRDNKRANK